MLFFFKTILSFALSRKILEIPFSYFSVLGVLMTYQGFWVFDFGCRAQNKNLEITENLYLWVCKVQIHVDLFFDHYFNFLIAKTELNKNELKLINLDVLEALKRQICGTWLGIWPSHFEISVIWLFFRISVISEFLCLGISFLGLSFFIFVGKIFVIPLFNWFFLDFSGFCDSWVFNLVIYNLAWRLPMLQNDSFSRCVIWGAD